ncbi:MAG: hypothetical protein ACI311_07390 [Bacilli bacterium]
MQYSYRLVFFVCNLLGTIIGALFLTLSLKFCKDKDYSKKVIPIKVAFFFLVILEIIKIYYLISTHGTFNPKSYPLIYCSSAMYFYAIIGFSKKENVIVRTAKGNMIFVFLVMGILYHISFPRLNSSTNLEGFILNVHSRVYHILLMYVAIYMIANKMYDFRFKDSIAVAVFNCSYFAFCTIMSIFIGGEMSNFGPESVELYWFYDKVGYATGNLILCILATIVSLLCYLIANLIINTRNKNIKEKHQNISNENA